VIDVCTNDLTDKMSLGVSEEPKNDYVGQIVNGVEVIDIKAIDTLGIPIKGQRKTWDKI
jgi:hypothetical protein